MCEFCCKVMDRNGIELEVFRFFFFEILDVYVQES